MYSDASIHACMIATPTFTHEEFILGSLRAKKAVLSEKPVSKSAEGTKECYAVAKENGMPLLCAFNRRFEPSFAALRKRAQEGGCGIINALKCETSLCCMKVTVKLCLYNTNILYSYIHSLNTIQQCPDHVDYLEINAAVTLCFHRT